MSKLKCLCGHTIVDQANNLSYKGYIIPDTERDDVFETFDNIDTLIEAIRSDQRLEWVRKHFSVPPYPTDLKDSSMIYDLVSNRLIETEREIFECENCGRIAIQVGQSNQFRFFRPEGDDSKGILDKKKQ